MPIVIEIADSTSNPPVPQDFSDLLFIQLLVAVIGHGGEKM
jgi:hypothetical protein